MQYRLAGALCTTPYWLANEIYPKYPFFVQTIQNPVTNKYKLMAKMQERRRKKVKRAFGMLQGKFHILARSIGL